jgi:hypothetical protein
VVPSEEVLRNYIYTDDGGSEVSGLKHFMKRWRIETQWIKSNEEQLQMLMESAAVHVRCEM